MNVKKEKKEEDTLEESDIEDYDDEEEDLLDDEYIEEDEDDIEAEEEIGSIKEIENETEKVSSSKQIDEDVYSEGEDYETETDSDEEEINDNYLQKFNDNLNMKTLENMHPEIKSVNYEEMIALARVVRDKQGRIIDPLHKTLPLITKYEKARIIGARAEQLDAGGEAYIPIDETIINGRTIALMEFEQNKIPFIIARPLPNGSTEYWHVSDLENILD
jgi:DNA-directed RNA polymerase subunit K/omega